MTPPHHPPAPGEPGSDGQAARVRAAAGRAAFPTLTNGAAFERYRRSAKALRSGLRRYPPELLASFARQAIAYPEDRSKVRDLLKELAPHSMALVWLGHASVMATLGQVNVVVDPVLSHRIGPRILGRTWGLSRRMEAPVPPHSLTGADIILLTHAHFDHLDKPTLRSIVSERSVVIAPRRCATLVPRGYRDVIELEPGATIDVGGTSIQAVEPRHWGARVGLDRKRGVSGYVVRREEGSILFAGDTAYTNAFDSIGPVDVAAFGIGAYNPWEHMHATPEQVWRMFLSLGARYLLPIHHSTFELSDEPLDEPVKRLLTAAGDDAPRILPAAAGEIVVVATPEQAQREERAGTA